MDESHSDIRFKARHLTITTVHGQFLKYKGTVTCKSERFEDAQVYVEIDAASVETHQPMRDKHLKSPDFFDVSEYPLITFQSTLMHRSLDNGDFDLHGLLTIKNITRLVQLHVEYHGRQLDTNDCERVGFTVYGVVQRSAFQLEWNGLNKAGNAIVSDQIRIQCEVQLMKRESASIYQATLNSNI